MPKAIKLSENGSPDVLKWSDITVESPKAGEVKIRHTAIGLNYIDTYHRSGLYPMPLPSTPGLEAAGIVLETGDSVTGFSEGDRITYPCGPLGAYSEERLIPSDKIVKIPDGISDEAAASMMLKACTVEFLIRRLYRVKKGDTVLFQAAAGGVGLLACQWLNALGATVIGTVSTEEKAALASENGCTYTVLYKQEDFEKRVMDITDGKGVNVVYDSAGKDTFMRSLNCLKRCGMMVTYGNTTGPVDPVPPALLAQKGSLILTRPTLMDYVATHEQLVASTNDVFKQIQQGVLKPNVNQEFALQDAAKAHRALEAGKTKGQTLLIP